MSFLVELPEPLYTPSVRDGFTADTFSIASARAGIWLCQLAYERDGAKQDRILDRWGLRKLAPFDRSVVSALPLVRTRGFIAQGKPQDPLANVVFVSFAGTDPLVAANWATDFAFLPDATGTHSGFAAALQAVWEQIKPVLKTASDAGASVIVTGHSLGGALAVLCAARARAEQCATAAGIYTYGQPRVAGADFAASFNSGVLAARAYRLVHGHDIVATVPPPEFDFKHVGRLLKCPRHGKFNAMQLAAHGTSDEPQFAPALFQGLQAGVGDLLGGGPPLTRSDLLGQIFNVLPPPIRDHLPDQYWTALTPAP